MIFGMPKMETTRPNRPKLWTAETPAPPFRKKTGSQHKPSSRVDQMMAQRARVKSVLHILQSDYCQDCFFQRCIFRRDTDVWCIINTHHAGIPASVSSSKTWIYFPTHPQAVFSWASITVYAQSPRQDQASTAGIPTAGGNAWGDTASYKLSIRVIVYNVDISQVYSVFVVCIRIVWRPVPLTQQTPPSAHHVHTYPPADIPRWLITGSQNFRLSFKFFI